MAGRSDIEFLWQTFGPFRFSAIILFVLLLVSAVFETLGIGMIMPLLDTALKSDAGKTSGSLIANTLDYFPREMHLLIVCGITVIIMSLKAIFKIIQNFYSSRFINNLRRYWTVEIMRNYLFSSYTHLLKYKRGELVNNMIHEPLYASKALRDIVDFLANLIICLFITILLFMVNWRLTLGTGIAAGIIIALLWKVTHRYSTNVGKKKIKLNQDISQVAVEAISGVRQLKVFSAEKLVISELSRKIDHLVQLITNFSVINRLPPIIGELLIVVLFTGSLIVYRYTLMADVSTLFPIMGLFVVSSFRLFSGLSHLVADRMSILSYLPSIRVVHSLSDYKNEQKDNSTQDCIERVEHGLYLQSVCYRFDGNILLFNGINLEFPKGRITAIVGPSGSGKSTICDLITKLYKPAGGSIFVDDHNLDAIDNAAWRERIGYVSQDSFLFNASIRENIMIGKLAATESDMMRAAKLALADEFIENLPERYETIIGESGVTLSGGQRQRIAIARALIRDPDVLIFDEATNALDADSERKLLTSLKQISKNKITIMVTHRLSSLWVADYIYYINCGEIRESGTFEELKVCNGEFSELLRLSERQDG